MNKLYFKEKVIDNAPEIYGQFLKTIKKFKRKVDNIAKFNERDIDAFRKRYEQTQKPLIPLIHDIKMNVLERMTKFGKDLFQQNMLQKIIEENYQIHLFFIANKIQILFYSQSDINQLKNHNFQMHLYTNKELCDITFKMFEYSGTYKDQTSYTGDQMKSLIKTLCHRYNIIPYHNWTHAFSVFQMQQTQVKYYTDIKKIYSKCQKKELYHRGKCINLKAIQQINYFKTKLTNIENSIYRFN